MDGTTQWHRPHLVLQDAWRASHLPMHGGKSSRDTKREFSDEGNNAESAAARELPK